MSIPPSFLKSLSAALLLLAVLISIQIQHKDRELVHPPSQRLQTSASGSLSVSERNNAHPEPTIRRSPLIDQPTVADSASSSSTASLVQGPAKSDLFRPLRTKRPDTSKTNSHQNYSLTIPVDSHLAGNSLTTPGAKIEVTAVSPTTEGPALHIDVIPQSAATSSRTAGLTEEQELFRTKWGWEIYDRTLGTAAAELTQTR